MVDDRKDTIELYKEILEKFHKHTVTYKECLAKAYNLLKKDNHGFNIVLIDLNIPPIPDELKKYHQKLEFRELNEGQSLGVWLDKKQPKLPYAYLTALGHVIDPKHKNVPIMDKVIIPLEQIEYEIKKVIQEWK
jgi:CheY-like chemotaxis protein